MSRSNALILILYVLFIASLTGGLLMARGRVLANPDTESSQQAWEDWRQEAARQAAGQGPVARRTPKATEAPTILLLRDHFPACLTLTMVISTVLFATFAVMIRGVLFGPQVQPLQDPESPRVS